MRALQVDTFASGIGGNHDPDIFVLFEQGFDFPAIITEHTAVDGYDGFRPAE